MFWIPLNYNHIKAPCKVLFLLFLINNYIFCDLLSDLNEPAILLSASGYGHMFFTGNFIININNIDVIIIIDSAEMLTNKVTH